MEQFDHDWRFGRADDASSPGFDDSTWRTVDLPHDWSIEDLPHDPNCPRRSGPFDPDISGGKAATGFFVGGVAWYRKQFELEEAERAEVRFEGAYCITDVWLNGHHLGRHVHGYTPFCFDITPYLNHGSANVLAVRVANEGANSRWYTGSGLYRHVWLKTSGRVHIPMDGVFVTTPTVSAEKAEVSIASEIENGSTDAVAGTVQVAIADVGGNSVLYLMTPFELGPAERATVAVRGDIPKPILWDLETPNLYTARVTVSVDGVPTDEETVTFGIRDLQVSVDSGFQLNGRSIKIKGGCVHHDNGLLGAAAIDRAEIRRIELLKAAGYNGIRTSHNASSTAFLDACDRLGMVVMDEAFDEWRHPKTPEGYSHQFDETCEAVLASQIRRDRNHPCVVMWSIGNEIPEQFADPDMQLRLRNAALRVDSTRPISQGICSSFWAGFPWVDWETSSEPAFLHLDLGGYNYQHANYEPDHARFPSRIMVGTESFPKDIFDVWALVEKHPWLIGDFTWTAMDYHGETGIGHINFGPPVKGKDDFPRHMASCGDLDILGDRKPPSFYRQAQWQEGILYLAVGQEPEAIESFYRLEETDWRPKWGWPNVRSHWTYHGDEGQIKQVVIYSSCDSVTLTLNGRLLGEKPTGKAERNLAVFDVAYEHGELKAIGVIGDDRIEYVLKTAGMPAALKLLAERDELNATRDELGYIRVEIVDADGVVVPSAADEVEIDITGPAELIAFGNADPTDVSSVQSARHRAWNGILQAIVRPTGGNGPILVSAEANGLNPGSVQITVRPAG